MKKAIYDFFRRGLPACGIGPLILSVVYLLMQQQTGLHTLCVNEVCTGILSLSALAFIAGGMNFIYQIERLPLMISILIHGIVLYISYLGTYLLNGWLEQGTTPVLVFTGIFVLGFLAIWIVIYSIIRRNTAVVNEKLKQRQDFSLH